MKRREFIALLGGAAAWPLAARAQQPKIATVGILVAGNTSPEAFLQGFRAALAAAGLIEGQNVQLEVRSAEGSDTLLPQKATELVRLKADVIVAFLTPAVQAARHVTSDIPIVMAPAGDPVATGLISSLARPGGNITESNQAAAALKLMERWIEQGQHLAAIARHLRLTKGASADLMRKAGQKALDAKDVIAVIEGIAAIVANKAFDLVDPVVMPGLRLLTEQNDTRWVSAIWFMPELGEFLTHLSESQSEIVLENLVLCARIDHDEEHILTAIAGSYPRSVWHFFKARLDRAATKERDEEHYEDIPFQLHELVQPLSRDPSFAVDAVRSWYAADQSLFQYRGGKLLHNVFPGFSSALGAKLVAIVQECTDAAINFVLTILQTYQGQPALHDVCKEVVDKLPENDSRLNEIEVILESTGIISGQFGFVEAYQRKKNEVSPWLSDPRPKVRAFAERYQRTLDRSIAAEQRRSETDYELRRREWPEEE
ncbi:MAG TPA: ABC transporter substrate binding protein [Bradyrhizobium sp.]|jgi:hypothetical protein|nr:ABC transporter substrate binding protein [Bradyrhizobium sp.]